jgi:hypothetical protein
MLLLFCSVVGGKFPDGKIGKSLENFRKFSNRLGIFHFFGKFLENFQKYSRKSLADSLERSVRKD